MLGTKHSVTDDDWREALETGAALLPSHVLDQHIIQAVHRVRAAIYFLKITPADVLVAWSGGKDSIAAYWIAQQADVTAGVQCMTSDSLEFAESLRWYDQVRPRDVFVERSLIDAVYLAERPGMLFPEDDDCPADVRRYSNQLWNTWLNWKPQERAYLNSGCKLMIFGRRTIDGNNAPAGPKSTRRDRMMILNPLHDWPHEAVIALCAREGLPWHPSYGYHAGFNTGPRPWARTSVQQIREREPEILETHKWALEARGRRGLP